MFLTQQQLMSLQGLVKAGSGALADTCYLLSPFVYLPSYSIEIMLVKLCISVSCSSHKRTFTCSLVHS